MCETARGHFEKHTLTPQNPYGAFPTQRELDEKKCLMHTRGHVASPWPVLPRCRAALTGAGAGAGLQPQARRADGSACRREQEGAQRRSVAARVRAMLTRLQREPDVLDTLR